MRFRPWLIGGMVAAAIVLLIYRFPYALNDEGEKVRLFYLIVLLLVAGGGMFAARHLSTSRMLKEAGAWLLILLLLVSGYAYREELLGSKLAAELMPARPQNIGEGEAITFRMQEDGHFYAEAYVNGTPVLFMVDTGASSVVLSPKDAERLGYLPHSLDYSRVYSTANGTVRGAPVTLNSVDLGAVQLYDIPASVNEAEMQHSLLGMSLLRRFSRFQVEGDTLTLTP